VKGGLLQVKKSLRGLHQYCAFQRDQARTLCGLAADQIELSTMEAIMYYTTWLQYQDDADKPEPPDYFTGIKLMLADWKPPQPANPDSTINGITVSQFLALTAYSRLTTAIKALEWASGRRDMDAYAPYAAILALDAVRLVDLAKTILQTNTDELFQALEPEHEWDQDDEDDEDS